MKGGKIKIHIPKEILRELYIKRKQPLSEIKSRYKCSLNTIAYWLRKYNIRIRNQSQSMRLFVNKPEIFIDKSELYDLSINKKFKLRKIAKKYDCKISTILNRLRKYKITNRFSNCKKIEISKEELEKLYLINKLNTYEIADIYGTCQATIWKRLKQYNIERRNTHELNSKIPSKEFLEKYYLNKRLSTWEIEKRYGYSRSTVHRKLREYGMIRNRAIAHMIYQKNDFSGNLREKAYLIGFRLGDLRVRKIWENSETIHVDCGSTIKEQIELIKNLFKDYGQVWISKLNKRGKVQIECYLNRTFEFLLSKKIPEDLLKDKENFFAFLAGFTDAEGTIGISKGMAYYSVVNQNKKYLNYIRNKLINIGIECPKMYLGSEKGTPRIEGDKTYYSNKDCWFLRLNKKSFLYEFLLKIEPYLKHPKKVKNLRLAKNNILERNRKFGE